MAQTTVGFNPFASRDGAEYESLSMNLEFDSGRLTGDDFVLGGALRMGAEGAIAVALPEPGVDATVGILVRNPVGPHLAAIPVLSNPVSSRGLVGDYFEVKGPLDDPSLKSLPAASITGALPRILQGPVPAIGALPTPKAPEKAGERSDDGASPAGPRTLGNR